MSLVTWGGNLLLSPGGHLTLGPAAEVCCCPAEEGCDCDCATMPASLTIDTGEVVCEFSFTSEIDTPSVKCVFNYETPDPDPCQADPFEYYGVSQILLTCSYIGENNAWYMDVFGDYAGGSLGGTLTLPGGACPPAGTYEVDMYNPSYEYVVTFTVTIP